MFHDIVRAFLFFVPAAAANMMPVFAAQFPWLKNWAVPMDFGRHYRRKRIFGDNKTWRGLLVGTCTGGIVAVIISSFHATSLTTSAPFLIGCLLGFGALFGDALESFVKRQLSIKPGQTWFPFDQLDFIIGGLVFVAAFAHLSLGVVLYTVGIFFGLHLLVVYLGYKAGIRERPI